MPSTATITTYYSFVAGTKARASEVTYNFGLYRGHNLPINPNTATAINSTYDLGSTEYRWRDSYVQRLDLQSNTTTGQALKLRGDTSGSISGIVAEINGVEVARFSNIKSMTIAAGLGQIAASPDFTVIYSTTTAYVTIASIQLNSSGNPVELGFLNHSTNNNTSIVSWFGFTYGGATIGFYMDNSLMTSHEVVGTTQGFATATGWSCEHPLSAFRGVFTPAAGNHTYEIRIKSSVNTGIASANNGRIYTREWK